MNPHCEGSDPSPETARNADIPAAVAIVDAAADTTLEARTRPPKPQPVDADDALRAAIVAALNAGDLDRVKALVAVLETSPKKASSAVVLPMQIRRPPR